LRVVCWLLLEFNVFDSCNRTSNRSSNRAHVWWHDTTGCANPVWQTRLYNRFYDVNVTWRAPNADVVHEPSGDSHGFTTCGAWRLVDVASHWTCLRAQNWYQFSKIITTCELQSNAAREAAVVTEGSDLVSRNVAAHYRLAIIASFCF
jgi:hypothetical protein